MQNKRIKLIYFSLGDSNIKEISLGWKKIVAIAFASFAILLVSVSLIIGAVSALFGNLQVTHLNRSNQRLKQALSEMNGQVKAIENKVELIEKNDDDLRVFVDMPLINSDIRKMGVGGSSPSIIDNLDMGYTGANRQALEIKRLLDNLYQRVELASQSRQEIAERYYKKLKELKQTPSIRPVNGSRVTDRFGYRLDPFIGRTMHHDGVDFSAPRGTEVFASADGVVSETVIHYKPNQSYGRYVIIDHGHGKMTRYAHLDKVLVQPGQRITRNTVIGTVGDTGKSTGPHLHYEVIVDNKPVNPENFILN
ncbi:MAG TPA: peptidoglycan DD-metalloendopeptidase family protein [bacterium]|nr:peptidoglycan DD-metalloendopeptidase family protein [bacterium]HPN34059.1 peptidoglycan DD-metalloendopeptidase family protein [bacterium]